jgi:DHA3 family tetracycline resistance protein-like MFS transporter
VRKPDAYITYLWMEAVLALIFSMIFTASSVYQVTIVALTPLQLVLVGTTLEATVFIFEVPTGIVADVYSRRLSIIIGMFLIGLGFMLEGSLPLFWTILLSQVLWGIGYTFTSGATQAWITDEIGEAAAGKAFLRSSQFGEIAALLGIGAGIVLGNIGVNIPILLGGIGFIVVGILLILIMTETGFTPLPRDERISWQNMSYTFRQGLSTVRQRPSLITILSIGLFYGLYSEGLDRLWTKHLLDNFTLPVVSNWQPVVWIGMIQAVGMLLSVGSVEIARRRINVQHHLSVAKALFGVTTLLAISLIVFALTGSLALALVAFWVIDALRSMIGPIYTAWVNQRLDSQIRATVLSMSSQADAIGQVAGGPILGMIGNLISVRAALMASGMILSPTLYLFQRTIRRGAAAPTSESADVFLTQ